jgi:endonuclease-8
VPEGPEIRLAADRVERVLQNQALAEVVFTPPSLQRFEKRLTGRIVTRIETRGKAMLTRFDNDLTLYSHNQLYGRWYTTRRPRMPDTARQLRVALHTATHSALLYSASDIAILSARQLASHPFLARLGPDILDPTLTEEVILERLQRPGFKNRAVGGLYLDQGFLAGNGNYLRSEILWSARVHPLAKPVNLSASVAARLAKETLTISRRSYRTRGVTLPDIKARALRAEGAAYESYRFFVYGREGLPCRQCGTSIERGEMGSRAVFMCPACQPS